MTVSRLSTIALARRVATHLDASEKFLETLNRPQLRDILETLDQHESALFFILGPVQFFKTLVGQLYLIRCHLLRPTEIGWYGPTVDFAKDFADGKLNRLLDQLPDLARQAYDNGRHIITDPLRALDKTKNSKLARAYCGGASHRILSAQTENDRTGKTFEKVLLDEPHLYEPGWIDQIFNRVKDHETTAVRLLMSTGMTRGQAVKGGEAAKIWDQTDQRLWHSRCPNCKKYFEPRYIHYAPGEAPGEVTSDQCQVTSPDLGPADLKTHSTLVTRHSSQGRAIIGGLIYERRFNDRGLPDESAISATLRYKCPRCGTEKLSDADGTRLAMNGTYERPIGLYVAQNDSPKSRHIGWNFSAIAGRAWLPIVMDWELAQLARKRGDIEPLGKVIREHFGGIWNPIDHIKEHRLRPPGGYKMADVDGAMTWGREDGTAWTLEKSRASLRAWWPGGEFDAAGSPYLIAAVDVQRDWFRLIIRFWNRRSQSRLLYAGTVTTPARIAEICDLLGVRRDRTVLDRGHIPQSVRMWCAQFGWRSLRGEDEKDYLHPDGVRRIISPPEGQDPFLGKMNQGLYKVVENKFAKWSALDRLTLLRALTANDGTPLFTAADDAPEWYFKELDAYVRIPKFKNGIESHEWSSNGADDHTADAECEGVAVASALNLTGAESLEPAPGGPTSVSA